MIVNELLNLMSPRTKVRVVFGGYEIGSGKYSDFYDYIEPFISESGDIVGVSDQYLEYLSANVVDNSIEIFGDYVEFRIDCIKFDLEFYYPSDGLVIDKDTFTGEVFLVNILSGEELKIDYTSTYHVDGYYREDCGNIYQIC